MTRWRTYRTTLLCLGLFLYGFIVSAQFDIPPKPSKAEQTAVYDYINLLSPNEKTALANKLIRYADTTSTQIVVAIISNTKGEDISFLGAKWGQKWGVGQEDEDNGIFIILAKDDRKIDINTGYGIEYRMSDRDAERIINRIMVPEFKNSNYYSGLDKGTDAIMAALAGEFVADEQTKDFPIGVIVILVFLLIWIVLRWRNRGDDDGTGSLLDVIILSNMGRTSGRSGSWGSGGGWSSGGGGSFGGGFGGGGFGGGGASGGW